MSYRPSPLHQVLNTYQMLDFLATVKKNTEITAGHLAPCPALLERQEVLNSVEGRKELTRWRKHFKSFIISCEPEIYCFAEPRCVSSTSVEGPLLFGFFTKRIQATPNYEYGDETLAVATETFADLIDVLVGVLDNIKETTPESEQPIDTSSNC